MIKSFINEEILSNAFSCESSVSKKIFTRYNKLDIVFTGFILFAMIIDSISVNKL